MPSKLKYMLIPRQGDLERIRESLAKYENMDRARLIEAYKNAWQVGIVGSHAQSLDYFAMHDAFMKRFDKSPIRFEENVILSLTEPIFPNGDSWTYQNGFSSSMR